MSEKVASGGGGGDFGDFLKRESSKWGGANKNLSFVYQTAVHSRTRDFHNDLAGALSIL